MPNPIFDFTNKKVVITGASRGIGRHLALEFAKAGASLLLSARNENGLAETAQLLPANTSVQLVPCDLACPDERSVLRGALAGSDILINNAGMAKLQDLEGTCTNLLRESFLTNVESVFCLSKEFAHQLRSRNQEGHIVNISSVSGLKAGYGRIAYGLSKAALHSLTAQLAVELTQHRIWVNSIAPGPVETDMAKIMHTDEIRKQYLARIPARRYAHLTEISQAVLMLASLTGIAGQVLPVDGGFSIAGIMPPWPEN